MAYAAAKEEREMGSAKITVAYVNPPKEGKKWGNIKDTKGNYYDGDPDKLALFKPNETCEIIFSYWGEKRDRKAIERKVEVPQALQQPVAAPPRARTNPIDQEQIFCTAHTKVSYTKDTTALEMIEEIKKLRAVWANTFGASEKRRDDEMADEIPY